ncbi:MAG TPA: multicopper oxidase domain-containing protein [Anaerolineales bacterium]|nr:multicopper oxidase domain-containing protein [Anaerolineales bacterium]
MKLFEQKNMKLSRRDFLKTALGSGLVISGLATGDHLSSKIDGSASAQQILDPKRVNQNEAHDAHESPGTVGQVDHSANGFDPLTLLYEWDYGQVSQLPNGQTLREFHIAAVDKDIEVAPGIFFPAWTYNGRVPGPSLRCVEGDRIRIKFVNAGSHPHTIHFHGIHPASMDGVPGVGAGEIRPGEETIYEFDAFPFGCHLYHCHANPLKRHIHKGLYGAFVIDPDPERHPGENESIARQRNHQYPEIKDFNEMVMMMNGFDTNFDGDNEVYAANSIAFAYMKDPIKIRRDQTQRLYLINITEFDPINSMHIHANFFDYYDHGTTLQPTLKMVDTIMQCQAQRGILEFSFKDFEPGRYMFHAHQSEFAELGWMGFFEVVE